jgi:hypothetical protein
VQDPAIEETLPMQIESLQKLTRKELHVRFREVCGAASPSSSHTHLLRRVAWHLQANALGGLKQSALKRASQLTIAADPEFPLSEAVRKELEETGEPPHDRDPRLPPVDTTIERPYRGKHLSVVVLENGFEYHGKIYASLSSIAHHITGTRWNGFHFFGLKEPWHRE